MDAAEGTFKMARGLRRLFRIILLALVLVTVVALLALDIASGSGDLIWTWNQIDLSEFSGQLAGFSLQLQGANVMICSGNNPSNLYIGATVPSWQSEQNYTYSGLTRFAGLGSRAGVAVYYQDPDNLYQVNIQSGDTNPIQGGFRLRRFNAGGETQLIEDNTLVFNNNTWYEFRLTVQTASDHVHFHLEMNDETGVNTLEYDDFSPARFTSGRVGLRKKQGAQACWDDLTVTSRDDLPPTTTPGTPSPSPTPGTPTVTNTPGDGGRATSTPVSTSTQTSTPGSGTSTSTQPPATATHTPGGGRQTNTPQPSPTASNTPGPGNTPTNTPQAPTATSTEEERDTPTPSQTPAPGTPSATPKPGRDTSTPTATGGSSGADPLHSAFSKSPSAKQANPHAGLGQYY